MVISFTKRENCLIYCTGIFLGLESGFWSGVLGAAVGNSLYMQNAKQLTGLTGIFVGIGDMTGASSVALVSHYGKYCIEGLK